ncbi:MAG: alpha-1 4-glucan-protein synthase, partial [Candidatus Aenigmatarchaeota archaeon]
GKNIITGAPLCIHNKAERSTFKDLLAEVPALELNEHLWNILGQMKLDGKTYGEIYRQIASELSNTKFNIINGEFLNFMGRMMLRWTECVERLV